MKSFYDVLGVSSGADPAEIRTAYLKRVKVLHPDRFDRSTQADEWQMANDMLKQLNAAYAELTSKEKGECENGHASQVEPAIVKCTHCGTKNRTPKSTRPAKCGRCGASLPMDAFVDLGRTQLYWNQVGQLIAQHLDSCAKIVPLDARNFAYHLLSLESYVAVNFQCQIALSALDVEQVNPAALKAGKHTQEIFQHYSSLITQRIGLISRAREIGEKNPYGRNLWDGFEALETVTDQVEWNRINAQVEALTHQMTSLDATFKHNLEVAAIELLAKYGEAFVI